MLKRFRDITFLLTKQTNQFNNWLRVEVFYTIRMACKDDIHHFIIGWKINLGRMSFMRPRLSAVMILLRRKT